MRATLLKRLAGEVPGPAAGSRFVLVAVDGVDGSGKSTFADALATELRYQGRDVVVIRADDFHNLREVRYRRGRGSPEGFWLDSYDYAALERDVLDPFGPGGDGRYRPIATDLARDRRVLAEQHSARPGTVAVVEGLFLHRDELARPQHARRTVSSDPSFRSGRVQTHSSAGGKSPRGENRWDYSVFLDVPFDVTAARMAVRDGTPSDPNHPGMRRYVDGQRLYFRACEPWTRATRVIDNSDLRRPAIRPPTEVTSASDH